MASNVAGGGLGAEQPIQVDPDALMQAANYISGLADQVRAERAKMQQSHEMATQGWVEPVSRTAYEHWFGSADEQMGQRETELRELAAHLAQTAQSFRQADAADTGGHGAAAAGSLVSGAIPQAAIADPKNPKPYDTTAGLPPGLTNFVTTQVAPQQQTFGGKFVTVGGAMITQPGSSPIDTGVFDGTEPPSNHAEAQTIRQSVSMLRQHPGDARVDLVTENLPCPPNCTNAILNGTWYNDLQQGAGNGSQVEFAVWHHGLPNGDLTLFSYELPPDASGQRLLYVSPQMATKMRTQGFTLPSSVRQVSKVQLEQYLATGQVP